MNRIKDILPNDIRRSSEGREGVEISLRHPYSEGCVFLSEGLAGSDGGDACHGLGGCSRVDEDVLVVTSFAGRREIVPDEFAETKLDETGEKR